MAVLIIGFQRLENIVRILEIVKRNDLKKVYISIDAPKSNDHVGIVINKSIRSSIEDFKADFDGELLVFFRSTNRGCAASVISSCNWVFAREKFAIVLEDDCIPSDGFFQHVERYSQSIGVFPENVMICGTQLAPRNLTSMRCSLSRYPMIWGWATSKEQWKYLSKCFDFDDSTWTTDNHASRAERTYWDAGKRRAQDGYIDVWDIVIARFMRQHSLFSILPPVSYISNVGSDQFATHTLNSSPFLFRDAESFVDDQTLLTKSSVVDNWIRDNVYGISILHIFSTRVTRVIDLFRKKPMRRLSERISAANRDFDQLEQ